MLFILTPPVGEPVSLDEAKAFLRVTIDAEDVLIASLITAVRQRVEAELGLALLTTAFRQTFDQPPDGAIALLRGPLISVESVAVCGVAGFAAVDPAAYQPTFGDLQPRIAPLNLVWPTPNAPVGGVRIDYTAGFGPSADAVPGSLKQAILALVAHGFDHRGEADTPPIALVEPWLAPYRRVRL